MGWVGAGNGINIIINTLFEILAGEIVSVYRREEIDEESGKERDYTYLVHVELAHIRI